MSLKFERYYSRKWHKVKTAKVTIKAGATSYKYKVRFSTKGSYRVTATHSRDASHTKSLSAVRKFTIK